MRAGATWPLPAGPNGAPGGAVVLFRHRIAWPGRSLTSRLLILLLLAQADLGSSPDADQCSTCLCAFRSTFINQVDASRYENVTRDEAEQILQSCISVVYQPMTAAGVDINSLLSLTACTDIPSCFTA